MRCSVIVPMLNEALALPALLPQMRALERQGCEVLVVDGGSDDGSADLARQSGLRVLPSPRGRARQMNQGAAHASGDLLLFLHADTRLPDGALSAIARSLCSSGAVWGRFDVVIEGTHPMLRVVAALMNRRSRWTGIATGDQAMFVTRAAFDAVGGFPDQPLMEDIELSAPPVPPLAPRLHRRAGAHLGPPLGKPGRVAHHRADVAPALGLLARRAGRPARAALPLRRFRS
jgi:rSAM/selenodomain-associated transferase 2